jgi:pyrroline-5-carboxylate reductase
MKYLAGFIGCGNMGGALAGAAAGKYGNLISVCDTDATKASLLHDKFDAVVEPATELILNSEFVFLGIKPQFMKSAIEPLAEAINSSEATVVTMAAGLSIAYFENDLHIKRPIIRIMPNTPCSIGSGMILYSCNSLVTKDIEDRFLGVISQAGRLDKIPEGMIDAASTVSGCGPAFAYIFAEALADAGVEVGLPRDKALLYAAQMLKGSAEMILAYGAPATLKDNVCSPGGTTIAGVHALEESGLRAAAMNAISASYKRTLELKK